MEALLILLAFSIPAVILIGLILAIIALVRRMPSERGSMASRATGSSQRTTPSFAGFACSNVGLRIWNLDHRWRHPPKRK